MLKMVEKTYMHNIHFDSSNATFGKVGMHGIIQVVSLMRMNEPNGAFDNVDDSKIVHCAVKSRGEFARNDF